MSEKLPCSYPEKEGVDSRAILNFLNAAEQSGAEIHGIQVLVHGKVIFEGYYAPYSREIPHIMHSFTKCLTNTAVGLAYSEGLLKLDDPIVKYLPEYADPENPYLSKATVRNLITMRSGQQRSIGGNEWRPLKTSWLDAYFRVQFDKEPGSAYMYSSGNSYVLSAIVQRLTGKTARDYVWEKVACKIGTTHFDWQLSPEGICSGGNGASLTVDDMARIGLLYLNKGNWQGQQLLSEAWVELALGLKDLIAPVDGIQYNFHWEHTGDVWAAKGMFGQTCALVPSLDMVVAFTAADEKYVLNKLLQTVLVDGVKAGTPDEAGRQALRAKAEQLSLLEPLKSVARHVAPRERTYRFRLDGSIDHVTAVGLTFDEDSVTYTMTDDRGTHSVRAGLDRWISGETSMTGAYLHHQYEMDRAKISACAYWSDEKTLTMAWRYPEMAFFDHLSITWEETGLRINRWVNMNSQDRRRPELTVAF